jgi:acyl-CoA synthetase (NDP forming)
MLILTRSDLLEYLANDADTKIIALYTSRELRMGSDSAELMEEATRGEDSHIA